MGGYGALRFVLKYPEMFAAAALLSPAIYDPEPPQASGARRAGVFGAPEFDRAGLEAAELPGAVGRIPREEDRRCRCTSIPATTTTIFIEAEATRLYSLLRKNGQPAELRIVDGAHRWPVWESTIGDAMRYVFRYAARPAIAPMDASRDAKQRKSR